MSWNRLEIIEILTYKLKQTEAGKEISSLRDKSWKIESESFFKAGLIALFFAMILSLMFSFFSIISQKANCVFGACVFISGVFFLPDYLFEKEKNKKEFIGIQEKLNKLIEENPHEAAILDEIKKISVI